MAWSLLQHPYVAKSSAGTSGTVTLTPHATGNLLVALALTNASSPSWSLPSGMAGASWATAVTHTASSVGQATGAWIAAATTTSSTTLTLSWGQSVTADLIVAEYSGLTGAATLDGTAQIQDSGSSTTTVVLPTYTPGTTGSLVLNIVCTATQTVDSFGANAAYSGGPAWSAGDTYVNSSKMTQTGDGWGYVTGATSLITPDAVQHGSSVYASIVFGVLAGGGGGGGASTPQLMMMGVGS